MMLRTMQVNRGKIHDLFQKEQRVFFCTVSESSDYRNISTIAMTGIADKVAIFTDCIG